MEQMKALLFAHLCVRRGGASLRVVSRSAIQTFSTKERYEETEEEPVASSNRAGANSKRETPLVESPRGGSARIDSLPSTSKSKSES